MSMRSNVAETDLTTSSCPGAGNPADGNSGNCSKIETAGAYSTGGDGSGRRTFPGGDGTPLYIGVLFTDHLTPQSFDLDGNQHIPGGAEIDGDCLTSNNPPGECMGTNGFRVNGHRAWEQRIPVGCGFQHYVKDRKKGTEKLSAPESPDCSGAGDEVDGGASLYGYGWYNPRITIDMIDNHTRFFVTDDSVNDLIDADGSYGDAPTGWGDDYPWENSPGRWHGNSSPLIGKGCGPACGPQFGGQYLYPTPVLGTPPWPASPPSSPPN